MYGETNSKDMDWKSAGQKTAYMPCNHYDNNSRNYKEIQLGDDKLDTLTAIKYLGSIFDWNGGAERDINNRVKLAWMKWKQLTGMLRDKKVPIKLKDKEHNTVIKPTMTYRAESIERFTHHLVYLLIPIP